MSIVINLDGTALQKLFPEGSEVRANVTAAAAGALLQKLSIKQCNLLGEQVKAAVDDRAREVLGEFMQSAGFARVQFAPQVEQKLRDTVKVQVDARLSECVQSLAFEWVDQRIKDLLDYQLQSIVERECKRLAALAVREIADESMQALAAQAMQEFIAKGSAERT